jgi:ABC-type antimicrobial peptide transport system permease subunit
MIVAIGIAAGTGVGVAVAGLARSYFDDVQVPNVGPALAAALVMGTAALAASLMPALRAARVDVLRALRTE